MGLLDDLARARDKWPVQDLHEALEEVVAELVPPGFILGRIRHTRVLTEAVYKHYGYLQLDTAYTLGGKSALKAMAEVAINTGGGP